MTLVKHFREHRLHNWIACHSFSMQEVKQLTTLKTLINDLSDTLSQGWKQAEVELQFELHCCYG